MDGRGESVPAHQPRDRSVNRDADDRAGGGGGLAGAFFLQVEGTLRAEGTAAQPITFRNAAGNAGGWDGLTVLGHGVNLMIIGHHNATIINNNFVGPLAVPGSSICGGNRQYHAAVASSSCGVFGGGPLFPGAGVTLNLENNWSNTTDPSRSPRPSAIRPMTSPSSPSSTSSCSGAGQPTRLPGC